MSGEWSPPIERQYCSCKCHNVGGECDWDCCQEPNTKVIPIKYTGEGRGLSNLSNRQTPKKKSKLRFFLALPFVMLGWVMIFGVYFGIGCAVVLDKLSDLVSKIKGE